MLVGKIKYCVVFFLLGTLSHAQNSQEEILRKINLLNTDFYQTINNNPHIGLLHAKEAFNYFGKIQSDEVKFTLSMNYVTALFINQNYKKALEVLEIAEPLPVGRSERALYHTMKGLVQNDLNDFLSAEEEYKKAREIYVGLEDYDNQFAVLNNLGLLYNNIGAFKESMEVFLECYGLIEKLSPEVDQYKYFLNLGSVNYNLRNYSQALESYSSALKVSEKEKDTLRIYASYEDIAKTNVALGSIEKGLYYYRKTLSLYNRLGLEKNKVNVLLNLGEIYKTKGDMEATLLHYKKALDLAAANKYLHEELKAAIQLGSFFREKGDLQQAGAYYERVISHEPEIINTEILKKAYFGLYKIAQQQQDAGLSLKYLSKYHHYDEILKQQQITSERNQMEARFTLAKKQLELDNLKKNYQLSEMQLKNQKQKIQGLILFALLASVVLVLILKLYLQKRKNQLELVNKNLEINQQNQKLKQKNTDIKAQQEELSAINRLKDQLLSIIAHDVKSPITNLSFLLHSLRGNMDRMEKKDLKQNLASIESDTVNLLTLLNNILTWTLSQSRGVRIRITPFSLTRLVERNLKLLESNLEAKGLQVVFRPKDDFFFLSDMNIVDLALRNILSNAVKFTDPFGEIRVSIDHVNDRQIELRISDSGSSEPEEPEEYQQQGQAVKEPIALNLGNKTGYGIGLSLCRKMLAKIDSKILSEKNWPTGTTYILRLTQQENKSNE